MRKAKTVLQLVVLSSLTLAAGAARAGGVVALDVTGPVSNPGKQERCIRQAQKMGFTINPGAPIRVMLILQMGNNRLQINSARRGEVLNVMRPGWGMEDLCKDAMQQAQVAISQDGMPPVAPRQEYAPPPPRYNNPPPQAYTPTPGGPPAFSIEVVGPQSNSGKQERCLHVAQRMGVVYDPRSPFRVILTLLPGVNKLQIVAPRGEIFATAKPPWGMEQLCEDAIRTGLQMHAREVQGGPPPRNNPPPPQYDNPPPPQARPAPAMALGPIPPGGDLPPNAKVVADRAVAAWSAARFDVALNEFREAGRIHGDPQFLFDQAVCEQRLGRISEAMSHTQMFIERAPQSPYRPYADQLMGELQQMQR